MSGGITLEGSSNNLLMNNNGQSNYIAGILINYFYNSTSSQYYYSSNNTLIENTGINRGLFSNIYFSAIQISGSGNTIINNIGIGMNIPGSGMSISGSDNLIAGNTGTSDFRHGIILSGSNNVVTGNIGRGYNSSEFYGFSYGFDFSNFLNNVIIENTGISNNSPGMFFSNSSNNLLVGNTAIRNNGISSENYGIRFNSCSNNTLINLTVKSFGGTGIYVDSSSNNLFRDSTIREGWSFIPVYYNEYSSSVNNTFINCTYYTSKSEIVQEAESELIREWYYNAQVKDGSDAPLSGVNISAFNSLGELQFSALTDSSGEIPKQELIDYINLGGTRTSYSPYTVSASKIGYTTDSHTFNFYSYYSDASIEHTFILY
jgi:parallel beta-helix repeat protein